jgi:glycosyltransferase involved in cell wall biosynthesis
VTAASARAQLTSAGADSDRQGRAHRFGRPRALPRVTVIIPCYNYEKFLRDCVLSALAQDGVNVDVMIVDDASTDRSPEVAAELAKADARVAVVQHERNVGHIATYNEALAVARGDYFVLISADDMLTKGSLARATAVMESRPDVGLVYGNPVIIYGSDVTPARTAGSGARVWTGPEWIEAQCRRATSCIYSPEACVRASVHRAVGGYNPALPHAADLELWLRIASAASVARVRGDQAYKRVHGSGMIQTTYSAPIVDLKERRDAYASFFGGAGAELLRAHPELAIWRRRLAAEALDHVCAELGVTEEPASELDAYLDFARELGGSELAHLWAWREYRLARGDAGRALRAAALRYGAGKREIRKRYKWYRWRLSGT